MAAPRSINELDTPVVFMRRDTVTSPSGAPVESWDAVAFRTMAKEETGSAAEGELADQVASFSRVAFWIRYRADVANTMRVIRNEQVFRVVAADIFGRRQWTRVLCDKVNDG